MTTNPIPGDRMQQILVDIGNETPPEKSRLIYGPDDMDFRIGVERRYKVALAENPKILLHVFE